MAKCWLCQGEIAVGSPISNNFLFGAAHPACDDGFVMGWNAQRDAIEKRERVYRSQETEADSNQSLGLGEETL